MQEPGADDPERRGVPRPTPAPAAPTSARVWGRERDFVIGVLLTVATLGVYHFYYHYKTHAELCAQLGRPDDNRVWLPVYVVLVLLLVWTGVLVVFALIPFAFLVVNQYRAIRTARERMELPARRDAVWFLLWGTLGAFVLVGPFVAYYNLSQNYNDIWRGVRNGVALPQDPPMVRAVARNATSAAPSPPDRPADGWVTRSARGRNGAPGASGAAPSQAVPAAAPSRFSIRKRPGLTQAAVLQTFRCPDCMTPAEVRGPPGSTVPLHCASCGTSTRVRLLSA